MNIQVVKQTVTAKPRKLNTKWINNNLCPEVVEKAMIPHKMRKGRKGKPHWRQHRMLMADTTYAVQREALEQAWYDYIRDFPDTNYLLFWHWLKQELQGTGARVVWDIEYDTHGIHFDDDEAKIMFMLRWS